MTETKAAAAQEVIEAYLKLGTALRRAGDFPEARRVLRRLLQRQPEDPAAASAYLSLGLISMETGKYQEAVKNFSQALRLASPEDQETRAAAAFSLGSAHLRLDHPRRALEALEQARDLGHDTAELWQQLASCLEQVRRWDDALKALERAIALDFKNARAYLQRAGIFRCFGRMDEALTEYNRAIELEPQNAWFIRVRGEIFGEMGRFSEALADFNKCLELDSQDAWAIFDRGITYAVLRHYEEALVDFSQVLEIDRDNAPTLARRGRVYAALERYQEALSDLRRAMELQPKSAVPHTFLGETYQFQGHYAEALAAFDQALKLNTNYPEANGSRGKVNLLSGHFEAGLADLNRAVELEADNDWFLYCRALAYMALGQEAKAERDLDAAIRGFRNRYGETTQDLPSIAIFNLALYHLFGGEVARSKELYSEALSQGPSPHLIREAIRDLEDLLIIFPNHTQAREMLTWLQERSKPGQATG